MFRMSKSGVVSVGVGLALAVGLLGQQAAAFWPKKNKPVAEAPPPPPPAVAPPMAMAGEVLEAAGAYRAYMRRAAQISPNFTDGETVANALRTSESYQSSGLLRGAVAYGAVAALQAPAFVADLRSYAIDQAQRQRIAEALIADPRYVLGFKGADAAAGLVVTAVGDDGLRLAKAGLGVKQSAYDIQTAAWSKAQVADRPGRLAGAKAAADLALTPAEAADVAQLRQAALSGSADTLIVTPNAAQKPYSPLVVRSMALAALAALGEAGDGNAAQLSPLLDEPAGPPCLNSARRNLYQCLAVAGPHYEDVFCLGQHAMIDTGVCLVKASGAVLPPELIPPPLVAITSARPYKPPAKAKTKAKRRRS